MANKDNFRLIGLVGYARVGKDTVAQILRERYGYRRCAFADPIKNMISAMLEPQLAEYALQHKEAPVLGLNHKGESITYRFLAQTLGTEWGRTVVDPQLWIKLVEKQLIDYRDVKRVPGVAISDVRFEDEAKWILKNKGELWVIERDIHKVRGHSSEEYEKWIYNYDYHLVSNEGSFEELEAEVEVANDWF